MGPTWVELVLGPFAETKGPRLPGRTQALPSAKKKPQHIEEQGSVTRRNEFVPVGLNLMNIVWQDLTTAMSQPKEPRLHGRTQEKEYPKTGSCYFTLNSQQQTCPLLLLRLVHPKNLSLNSTHAQHTLRTPLLSLDEASKQMERALQLAREVYGNDHPEVAKRLGNLGVALNGLERYDKAEELQRKALEIRLRHGQEGSELFKIRGNLATTLMYLGKYEESERLFLANLNSRIRLYASVNPFDMDIARSHHNLGAFYFETENLDKAELHLREALTMRREAYGAGHTAVAATLGLLGRVVAARGDVPTAEKLYDEALRIRRKRLGDDHPDVGRTLTNLAALKIDTELDQAQDLIDQAIVILHESQEEGAEGRELAEARSVLGEILSHRDRFEEAEQYLLHSYRRLLNLRGPNAVPTRQARQRIHDHYQRWSRPDEWDRFEKQEAAQGSETSSPNP